MNKGYAIVCGRIPVYKKLTANPQSVSTELVRTDAPRARHASQRNQNVVPTSAA